MKKLKFKLFTLILIIASFNLSAKQQQEFQKKINWHYKVNQSTILKIENKFGNINIKNWEKNEIQINVTIKAKAKNENSAKKIFNRITINLSKDTNIISLITEIKNKGFQIQLFSVNTNEDYSINYDIFAPVYLKLDLSNKFGDIFINEIHSKSNISIKYGSLRAKKILFPDYKPYGKISISYGDAKIDKITWTNIISKYSEFDISESQALFIYGRYSEYKFNKNIAVICDSKFDDYKIKNTDNFVITGAYNDVKIGNLKKQLVVDSKYGDYKIENIDKDFTKIRLSLDYVDIKMAMSSQSEFKLKINAKYTDLDLPQKILGITNIEESNININKNYNSDNSKNKVNITSTYGDISIKFYN